MAKELKEWEIQAQQASQSEALKLNAAANQEMMALSETILKEMERFVTVLQIRTLVVAYACELRPPLKELKNLFAEMEGVQWTADGEEFVYDELNFDSSPLPSWFDWNNVRFCRFAIKSYYPDMAYKLYHISGSDATEIEVYHPTHAGRDRGWITYRPCAACPILSAIEQHSVISDADF